MPSKLTRWSVGVVTLLACVTLWNSSQAWAGSSLAASLVDLKIDANLRGSTLTEPGYTAFTRPGGSASGTVTVGGVSVTVTTDSTGKEVDRGAGVGSDLLRDFIYSNTGTFTIDIGGLTPNAEHVLSIFSIDVTTNDAYSSDWYVNGDPFMLGYDEPGGSTVPVDPSIYTIGGNVFADASGMLSISAISPSSFAPGGAFIPFNGFTLQELQGPLPLTPEPSTYILFAAMALCFGAYYVLPRLRRRHLAR